uniref:Uncharacterized protein n=1 Tax=Arundo donax TaxID=35708 RepID=A0A0A9D7B7_ARUDO
MATSSAAITASPYPLSFTSAFSNLNFVFAPQITNVSLHVWWRWLPRNPPGWICPTCSNKQTSAPPGRPASRAAVIGLRSHPRPSMAMGVG